jgi:hypothetical protein
MYSAGTDLRKGVARRNARTLHELIQVPGTAVPGTDPLRFVPDALRIVRVRCLTPRCQAPMPSTHFSISMHAARLTLFVR